MNAAAQPHFVLASSSPRRLELLRSVGINPDSVIAPEIDEDPKKGELPRVYVQRMAAEKNKMALSMLDQEAFVLTADTVVACGRRILGKPVDEREAVQFLRLLSGRQHRVMTAIALVGPTGARSEKLVTTQVKFKRLGEQALSAYIKGEEWRGKAGGYAIQGAAAAFIPRINGSYSNVVGLPLAETVGCLEGMGYRMNTEGLLEHGNHVR